MGGISHTKYSSQPERIVPSLLLAAHRVVRLPSDATSSTTNRVCGVLDRVASSLGSISHTFGDATDCAANSLPETCQWIYQISSESHFDKRPTANHIASSVRYTCRAINQYTHA